MTVEGWKRDGRRDGRRSGNGSQQGAPILIPLSTAEIRQSKAEIGIPTRKYGDDVGMGIIGERPLTFKCIL